MSLGVMPLDLKNVSVTSLKIATARGGEAVMLTYSTSDQKVWGCLLPYTMDAGCDATLLGAGSSPDVAIYDDPLNSTPPFDEVLFFSAHDNGYCWNANGRNQDEQTHVCDRSPTPMTGTLNYHFGPVAKL